VADNPIDSQPLGPGSSDRWRSIIAWSSAGVHDRLLMQQRAEDPPSRRHHYVPQSYLRQWSFDGKRVWTLDTVTGISKPLGTSNVCVKENFYRVVGPDGSPHNRVELLFGVSIAVQRMRTLQQRRLHLQYDEWLLAQNPEQHQSIDNDAANPNRLAGIHTELLFKAMWEAADVLTTRQIEIWHDPQGRFLTCDAPVLVPFRHNVRPSLISSPYIVWPVSPYRVVALANDLSGRKALLRKATGSLVGTVQKGVEQGRERMIFATEEQCNRLPKDKPFRRRAQTRLRCSQRTPSGEIIPSPGCCVEWSQVFASAPDVSLCNRGLHAPAPKMWSHV